MYVDRLHNPPGVALAQLFGTSLRCHNGPCLNNQQQAVQKIMHACICLQESEGESSSGYDSNADLALSSSSSDEVMYEVQPSQAAASRAKRAAQREARRLAALKVSRVQLAAVSLSNCESRHLCCQRPVRHKRV